jgi:hypothetical protein
VTGADADGAALAQVANIHRPSRTRVSVPAHVSRVIHRVPRTVATLVRPRVRKRP